MNAYLELAEAQTPSPVKARRRAAQRRALEKALRERDQQFRLARKWHDEQCEAVLAGPHAQAAHELIAFLNALTLDQAGELVALVERGPWRSADPDIRYQILRLVDYGIVRLRERADLPPFNDSLPFTDEAPTAFERIPGVVVAMIKTTLANYVATIGRVFEDREQTVGASDVGQCARRVFWAKMAGDATYGAVPDPGYVDGWGARIRGTIFENAFWTPALRARFGDKLRYAGPDQRTLVSGFLSATPDGLLIDQPRDALADLGIPDIGASGEIVIEAKTIDPRARLDEARAEHSYQVQIQMGLLREVTSHRPDFAVISYTDASFWDEVTEFVIAFDPAIYANAQRRAAEIMLATSAEELRPEGWIAGGRECARCPFTIACGQARTAVPGDSDVEPDPQFVAELHDLARACKAHEADANAAGAKLRELQNEIRERLRAKGLRRVVDADVRITWSAVKGRPSYDIPAIRQAAAAAGLDLAEYETVGEPSDRLVIQVLGQTRPMTRTRKKELVR